MLISEDSSQRARPPSSTRKPRTKNGTELLIRWSQPACRNGCGDDPGQAVDLLGVDAEVVQPVTGEGVDNLQQPEPGQQRQHDQRRGPGPRGGPSCHRLPLPGRVLVGRAMQPTGRRFQRARAGQTSASGRPHGGTVRPRTPSRAVQRSAETTGSAGSCVRGRVRAIQQGRVRCGHARRASGRPCAGQLLQGVRLRKYPRRYQGKPLLPPASSRYHRYGQRTRPTPGPAPAAATGG